ncbi:MAG TPA: glycerophosphodiester phosphodiesterase [Patescibacteria group bacterium]|nr:glycerophosphodiester phosphodiesterase [Patescibacteria group bacterium]
MTKIIGHRGARGLAPENTIASFKAALQYKVDEIELDVRVTKDGQCALSHDPWLHDKNGQSLHQLLIAEHTLAELRKTRPDLPTLEEAIRFIGHRVPVIIEVKPGVSTAEVILAVRKLLKSGWSPEELRLASFSQPTLRELQTAFPQIEKVINGHFFGWSAMWRAHSIGAKRLALNHHLVWWGMVSLMSHLGFKVGVHALNDPQKAARWSKYGLYAVITDYPDRFQKK